MGVKFWLCGSEKTDKLIKVAVDSKTAWRGDRFLFVYCRCCWEVGRHKLCLPTAIRWLDTSLWFLFLRLLTLNNAASLFAVMANCGVTGCSPTGGLAITVGAGELTAPQRPWHMVLPYDQCRRGGVLSRAMNYMAVCLRNNNVYRQIMCVCMITLITQLPNHTLGVSFHLDKSVS